MADIPAFTPVNLLTGFLGSGKTTLLRRLLCDPALSDTAVLINEFGEIGLDHHLVEHIDDTIMLLQSGCVCCTVRGELADALRDLLSKRERCLMPAFSRIVIESTGLADPFPILSTLKSDPVLRHHVRPGSVITTVDAVNGVAQLDTYVESNRQAAIADRLVVTKIDLAGAEQEARLKKRLSRINPDAAYFAASENGPDAQQLLSNDESRLAGGLLSASGFYCDTPSALINAEGATHQSAISSFVVTCDEPLDWTGFGIWLTMLLNRHGARVLRVKGILNIAGEERPVAIHAVQHLVHQPVHMKEWPSPDRTSRIVFIVDDLDPELLKRSLNAFTRSRMASVAATISAGIQHELALP